MIPNAGDILALINTIAPFRLAEKWDNCGLSVGNPKWPVKKILVALDASRQVMAAACDWQADMVLTHHPLFIEPEKSIDFGKMPGAAILKAARNKICVVSAHTNLDKANKGLNDYFCRQAGLPSHHPLVSEPSVGNDVETGIGRVGELDAVLDLKAVADLVKSGLGLAYVRMVGDPGMPVKRVAVCTGSGGSLIPAFLESGADVYITGDVKYHDATDILAYGKAMIDVGHFGSEIIAIDLLTGALKRTAARKGFDLELKGFGMETDPFTIV